MNNSFGNKKIVNKNIYIVYEPTVIGSIIAVTLGAISDYK